MINPIGKMKYARSFSLMLLLLITAVLLAACGGPGDEGPGEESLSEESSIEGEVPDVALDEILSPTGSGLCANPYLPVVVGATWTYEGTEETLGTYTFVTTIINVRPDGFTHSNDFNELVQEQEWVCLPEGLQALQYNRGAAGSVTVAGTESIFETSDVSGVSLPNEISIGDSWEQSFSISGVQTMPGGVVATSEGNVTMKSEALGQESVSVQAGEFEAMKLKTEVTIDLQLTMDDVAVPTLFTSESMIWYATGVGWVKSEDRSEIFGVESLSSIELVSYSIP